MNRCKWVNLNNPIYVKYHDEEWGVPSYDDKYLFEMLILESFQCILNKRKAFYKAFDGFNYEIIAKYKDDKINKLINNKEIVRNKRKILATINNAKVFISIQKEYKSFSNYIWSFTDNKIIYNNGLVTSNELSDTISNDLKKRGMSFVGTTIIYSYLQAVGVINDHEDICDYRKKD